MNSKFINKVRQLLILNSALLTFLSSCSIQKQISQSAKADVLDAKALQTAHVGISIFDPAANKYLYNYQGDKYFVPASNMKLPTCYAAMKYLGDSLVGLRYKKEQGEWIMQGTGDPTFLLPEFKQQPVYNFIKSLADQTLIHFSTANWDESHWGSGWSWNDFEEYYMAERSPFPIYGNMVKFALHGNTIKSVPSLFEKSLLFLPGATPEYARIERDLGKNEFLIEYLHSSEGYHVLMYPFEGRFVHEGMAALVAYRISQITPITFSIAMNDYGFELLSDQEIPIHEAVETNVLGNENLLRDIQASINSTEMARRKFRDIAAISGLIFKGLPGQKVKERHLQSSSQLFFNVFHEYESHNLLLLQAFEEVMDFQLEEARLRKALDRIAHQKIIIAEPVKPTPFAFPIMVDRTREKLTSERLEDQIKKMKISFD